MHSRKKPIAHNPEQNLSAAWNVNTPCVLSCSVGWQTQSGVKHTGTGSRLIFGDFRVFQTGEADLLTPPSQTIGQNRWHFVDLCTEVRQEAHWRVKVNRSQRGSVYGLFARMGSEHSVEAEHHPGGTDGKALKRSNSLRHSSEAPTAGAEVGVRVGNTIADVNLHAMKGRLKRSNTVHASSAQTSVVKGFRDRIFTSPASSSTASVVPEPRKSKLPLSSVSKQLASVESVYSICEEAASQTEESSSKSIPSPISSLRPSVSSPRLEEVPVCVELDPFNPSDAGDSTHALPTKECVTESARTAFEVNSVTCEKACEVSGKDIGLKVGLPAEESVILCGSSDISLKKVHGSKDPEHLPLEKALSLQLPNIGARSSSFHDMTVMTPEEELAAALAAAERSRRSSDSSALKEEHIRRSEQFSEMLKQLKQKGTSSGKLSPYGLGVLEAISEKKHAIGQFSPPPRRAHNKEYFDAWLKDQSERISTLRGVLDGDNAKLQELRRKVRQWPLEIESRQCGRSKSMKLPRRVLLLSEDDKYPSDSETTLLKRRHLKKHYSDSEAMRKQRNRKLSAECAPSDSSPSEPPADRSEEPTLADPVSCVSSSADVENVPLDVVVPLVVVKKEGIVFSKASTSSMTKGANVAVVKPMRQLSSIGSEIASKSTVTTYYASAMQVAPDIDTKRDLSCSENCCCGSSVTMSADRHCTSQARKEICASEAVALRSSDLGDSDGALDTMHHTDSSHRTVSDLKFVPRNTDVAGSEMQGSASFQCPSGDENDQLRSSNETTTSVKRISASLNQLMGDLRTLRSQDVDLARKLIGLGRSIRQFRHQRDCKASISEAEDGFADDSDNC